MDKVRENHVNMLTEHDIQNIVRKIVTVYKPEKIFIFGSYANGTAGKNSDLDILIIKRTDENFFNRIRKVRKLLQPQPVALDILVYTPEEFEQKKNWVNHILYIVNKQGKLVYERKHKKLA